MKKRKKILYNLKYFKKKKKWLSQHNNLFKDLK